MLIRAEHKLQTPQFKRVAVHIWDGLTSDVKVAIFHKHDDGTWRSRPWEIGFAKQEYLDSEHVAYIQGKLAHKFLYDRGMRIDKNKARLVWRQGSSHYSGHSEKNTVVSSLGGSKQTDPDMDKKDY